jgi:hypothetical protein
MSVGLSDLIISSLLLINPTTQLNAQLNEGTPFSTTLFGLGLSGTAEVDAFERFVRASQIDESKVTQDTLDEIASLYLATNAEQLPFSTGDFLFDSAAAWYGDSMFLAPRRRFSAAAAESQAVFVYYFTEFVPGDSPRLGGTTHLIEWHFDAIFILRISFCR